MDLADDEEVLCRANRWSAETGQGGSSCAELIRKTGITEQTYYCWKAKHAGLEVDQVRQIKQLREKNTKLKQLVAELTLNKTMLQDVLRKKF